MAEAVPLGELLHEEALLIWLYRRQKGGITPRTLIPIWTLPLCHISSSLGVARPFTNKVEKGWKNVQTLWWAELDRLHSMTRAHPGFFFGYLPPPPLAGCLAPLEILLYIYCNVQHAYSACPLWYAKTAILPPLSKILNAALHTLLCIVIMWRN